MFVRKRIGRCYNCYANVVTFQISNKTEVELIKYCSQCNTTPKINPAFQNPQ